MGGTFRTSPPGYYITPSREEITEKAKEMKISKFSTEMVQDLCNLAAGGKLNPPSSYRSLLERAAEEGIDKFKSISYSYNQPEEYYNIDGDHISNRYEAIGKRVEKMAKYHQNVMDFLQSIDVDKFPGRTPLEQALNVINMLMQKTGDGQSGDNSEPLPSFTENNNSEEMAKNLNEIMDQVESLSQDEKDLLDPENNNSETEDQNLKPDKGDGDLQKQKIALDFAKGKDVMLEISRNLDKLTRMQVRKSKKLEPDSDGDTVRNRPIKHLGEMNKLAVREWALPESYRLYRMVTNSSPVRERVKTIEKKQLLYMIVDCSGSMNSGRRIYKAGGIIMNRLKAVIAGEAEVYIRLFDTKLRQEHHVTNASEAKKAMKYFTDKNYSGGNTAIANCAKEAQSRIEEIMKSGSMYKPELVIITDGEDDTSSLTMKDFKGSKMHAFVVECENKKLTDFAIKTGGVGINKL